MVTEFATPPVAGQDWRLALPEPRRRAFRRWFWSIAAITLGVLIVGGVTRLTRSGLSIVDWDPIMGVIPPLNDAQWEEAFAAYQQFPEYQRLRQGMTMSEFRFIFFWEYLHRLLARAIGLVFLLPFVVFAVRGWFNRPLLLRSTGLFALGAMQGLMGWLMVASGLVDQPNVSHFRLAAHLSLAFLIFGTSVWLAREMAVTHERTVVTDDVRRRLRNGLSVVGVLLCLQIIWGAFVAGLKAGFFYNTFPLMGGRLVPEALLGLEPLLYNFVENPVAVQWTHRVLGTLLLVAAVVVALRIRRSGADARSRGYATSLAAGIGAQYLLGIWTLIAVVPISLGVLHQVVALLLFGLLAAWLHHYRQLDTAP